MQFLAGLMVFGMAPGATVNAAVTNDVVVGVTGFNPKVVRLNGASGVPAWTYTSPLFNSPIAAIGMDPVDQSVYFAIAKSGHKVSSSGGLVWGGLLNGFPAVNWGNIPNPTSFAFDSLNRHVYASGACSHGWMGKITPSNGSLAWSVGSAVSSALDDVPSLSVGDNDGSLYGVAGNNKALYKYSGNGTQIFKKTNFSWSVLPNDCSGGRGDFSRFNRNFYGAGGNTSGVFPTNFLYRLDQNGNVLDTFALPLNARVTGVAVDNASASPGYGAVYVSAGNSIYRFSPSLSLIWGPVNIGNTADFLAVEPLSGGLFVASIGGKFVQQRFTFNGGQGWTYSTGAQAPSSLSTQRLVSPYAEFSSPPQTLLSGQCSAAVTVQTRTAQNGVATTGGLVTLASSDGTIQFYSAPGCGGSPVTSITIPAGSSSAGFYFKGTTAGAPEIMASLAGFAYASQNATINVPKLAFTTPAVTATAGACSATFATVQSQNPNGSPLNVQANTPVSLTSSDGTMQFYTTSGCGGSAVTSITISAGSSSANFYLRSTTAGTPVITASAAGYANATQTATIAADTTPPAAVANLVALGISETQARLTWTSPGDDGSAGSITNGQYDIRWSPVDPALFDYNTATPVLLPATGPPGQSKSVTIDGLPTGMIVSFGLKTADTAGNVSNLSNIASAPTFTVSGSVDTVVRMAAPIPVNIVVADQSSSASVLQIASNGGLSPASAVYELTPSPHTFSSPARVTFKFNPATVDVTTLAIYKAATPTSPLSSVPITNQTIDLVANTISGDVSSLSFFVLLFKTQDALPPRSVMDIGLPSFSASQVFITSTTRLSFTAVDDLEVVGDGRGSGVAQTRYAIDAAAFGPFVSSFTIVGSGLHTIRFFSTDLAGNTEGERTSTVAVDNAAPATALAAVGGKQASGPDAASLFASSDTRISLSATDPLVSGVASGLALTYYQDNAGPLQTYSTPFLLTQGSHTLNYHSRDNLGNAEVAQSSTILIDATAPVSTASVGAPLYVSPAGVRFISPTTPVTLSAVDPMVANVASGVERLEVSVDGGAFVTYASALTFAEGRHVLLFRAIDRVGNRETDKTLELQVDATAPLTARGLSGGFEFTDAGGELFVSSGARLAFAAADPVPALPGALASGIALTQYRLDAAPTAPFTAFVSPLAPLAEGRHVVEFRSQDNVGNLETTQTLAVTYDATAPAITITAPAAGSYVATKNTIPVSFTVTDNFDPAPTVSAVLTQLQDRGSPRGSRPAVVAVVSGQVLQPLSLDDGLWQLRVSATDFVQNAAAAAGDTFEVVHDTLAPRSTLAVGSPQASGGPGGSLFVTRDTLFTLASIDDLVNSNDAAGLGVSFQDLKVNAALRARFSNASPTSGQTFTSTFTLSADGDGTHALSYYAEDVLANREAARSASVAVDNTAPLTTLVATGGEQYPGPDASTFYASLATRISLAAVDPLVNGIASGAELTQYQDNGGALQTFTAPFGLAEGSHALSYRSRDRVQNQEVTRSSTVLVDATAPATTAGVGTPHFVGTDGARYVTPASTVTFSAADPALPGGHAGSGIDRVELSLDGGAFAAVSATLTLAEGRHTLLYRALDNVGNTETPRSLELRSDATPPVTTAQLGTPLFTAADGTHYIAPVTPISFSAVDPLVSDVASGVQRVEVSVDGGAFAAWTTPLTFAEGRHTLLYRAVDNVGNVEATRTLDVQSDATAPASTADVGIPAFISADGTRYVTPATPVAILAADPAAANVASGVERIEVNIDSAGYVSYSGALFFAEGRHTVLFRAVDKVGNVEAARSLILRSDATPPVTALSASGSFFTAQARDYAPASFTYSLSASDPEVNGVASGVALTRYSTGGPLQNYASAFSLAEGIRQVEYQSQDNVVNLGALKSSTIYVDATAPASSLTVGSPSFDPGAGQPVFVAPATRFSLAADDLLSGGVASGLRLISLRLGTDPFTTYMSSFGLNSPDGLKTVEFFAEDNVANRETAQSKTFVLDGTAPATSLSVQGGRQHPGPDAASFYASSDTRLTLPAVDPSVNGAASGVALTEYQDNSGPLQSFASALNLSEGRHALSYRSRDRVENLEVLRSTAVLIDATPPVSTVQIGSPLYADADGINYVTPATPISLSAADPALPTGEPGSGLARIEVSIDGGPFVPYTAALTFAEGRHTLRYRALDNVVNSEATRSLEIYSDDTNPQTNLAILGPQAAAAGGAFYAAASSRFELSSVDPDSNGVASGLAFTRYQDNGGAFQGYGAAFALTEGSHVIGYQSQDNVGHLEALRTATVLIDASAPQTTVLISTPLFTAADGTRYVTPRTPVAFSADDSAVNGVASGVERIEVSVDGSPFTVYGGALTFPEGRHTVAFRALDRVGNTEIAQTLSLQSDDSAPLTALLPSGSFYVFESRQFAPASFSYSLSAQDPVVSQVASGAAFTRFRTAAGPLGAYSAAFTLAEGVRQVEYQSQDNVDNLEALKSSTIHVDATAPTSGLTVGSPSFDPGAGQPVFVAPATRFSLAAVDPLSGGVASGLRLVSFRRGTDPFMVYASSFGLAAPDGLKTVEHFADDNVGNVETTQFRTFALDGTAPATSLSVQGGRQYPGPNSESFYASADTLLELSSADPIVDTVASGVALIEYQDNGGSFQSFGTPLSLAEGRHVLSYRSRDRVENLEVLRSTAVLIDATPPVSTVQLGSPLHAVGTINYVTPATPVTLSAIDSALPTGEPGSGVARIEVSVDGGPFFAYTAALSFNEGRHTLRYRALDNVANTEEARSLQIYSDDTTPQTALAVLGRQSAAIGGAFYASAEARFELTAVDPEANGVASGLAFTRFQDNGGAFQSYGAAFALGEGSHVIGYQSQDNVGHLESLSSATAHIDGTAPVTTASVGAPLFIAPDGARYVTPATPVTFSAVDPLVNAVASGVERIEVSLNGGAFAAYTTALTFAEGRHTVRFRATDNVGNVEAAQTLELRSDANAPVTALEASGAYFAAAGRRYAPAGFSYRLPASDPLVNDVASGLAFTRYREGQLIDGQLAPGALQPYAAPFILGEGIRRVEFQSQDNVGNLETLKEETVHVDATSPVTALSIGAPSYDPGGGQPVVIARQTLLSLASQDPVVAEVASGVNAVSFRRNGDPYAAYSVPFGLTLADGVHAVSWFAADNVANVESARSAQLALDSTAPRTTLVAVGGRQHAAYASSDTRFELAAVDPAVNDVASGVAFTRYSDNGGALQTYSTALSLPEGSHILAYHSEDRVANLESATSTEVLVDATAPETAFQIGAPSYAAADGVRYVAPATPVTFTAVDPALAGATTPGSGVARIEVSVDGAPFTAYASALMFPEGRHTIAYRAIDNVGNVEEAKTLLLRSDGTAPVTTRTTGQPLFVGADGTHYLGATAQVALAASDPVVKDVASGVARIEASLDGAPFSAYAGPLTFAEGLHQLAFRAADQVDNVETAQTYAFRSDRTAPVTTASVGAPLFIAPDGARYVTPATPVTFSAVDPLVNAVASGVERIEISLNGGAFAAYTAALTFAEGRHTVRFRATDNVGNVEAAQTLELRSDATPPVTALAASGEYFITTDALGERRYAPPSFSYTLPATDPVAGDVASGLASTRYRAGQVLAGQFVPAPLQPFLGAFALAEGVRRVEFESTDNVGNAEALKSETVSIDASAPVTSLSVGEPQYDPGAGQPVFISPLTKLTLASVDPIVQEVASGVRAIQFRREAEPFSNYAAPFSLPLPDGVKTVEWSATDNVGNAEAAQSRAVALDATAPVTSLAVLGGAQYPGPDAWTFYASPATRYGLAAADPAVNSVASGVDRTEYQDNGAPFQSFAAAFALSEGSHALAYRSSDRVQNLEVARSTTVLVDATPPVTSVSIGAPLHVAEDGTKYLTPATPVSFSAADPRLAGNLAAGSGVRRIEVAVDGAPFAPYSSALLFPEGRHTVLYRSVDNVGNVEAEQSLAVQSDATPPASTLAVGAPQHQLPDGLLVSTRTPFSLAAIDPLSNGVASGVKDSFYRVADLVPGSATYQTYAVAFTLGGADVRKVIEFYSRDNVLNTEAAKSSVVLLDSTGPELALRSPASCDSGICRVLNGRFPVLGTARDAHFQSYALESAPGKDAAAGFVLVSSGTVAVNSGTLGVWDTGGLSGWQTLRLSASDLVGNVTVLTLNVFVGDPATLLVLGGHETFNMPEGVAVGTDGKIYVADRNNDRVAVFSSTGAALAAFGGRRPGEDDDHPRSSTSTLRFKQPSALAVDGAGSIYVADTGHHRVLKLSAAGEVLLDLGRRNAHREEGEKGKVELEAEFKAGRAPGEFKKPAGIAVDAAGRIYVSDTDNHRVQVFSSTGVFALAFSMPPLPSSSEHDETEPKDDDDGSPELGKPAGIALDSAGNIYVADSKGRRVLAFDAAGRLLMTVPVSGRKPGQSARPVGIAVSPSGECMLVSDQKGGRILKYDFQGNLNLAFGRNNNEGGERRAASSIKLRKPSGLALDAAGALYVVDRNNERVKKFSLPDGSATVFMPPQGPDEDHNVAREVIDREDGGLVERKDRAAVSIPADALPEDLKISVTTPTAAVAAESRRGADDKNMKVASPPVEYQPHGTEFEKPVTLTIPYNPELLAAQNAGDADLKVHYWNPKTKAWEELDSTVDKQSRTVTAKTTHFSLYQVYTGTSTAPAVGPLAADASFGVKAAYAFPNPARGVGSVTIRIQPGLADSVQVNVYDVSGRKVHSSSNFRDLGAFDDGNGLGAQFTYEHVWDISGVGSGVYAYVITARKSGERDIHRSGKIGVVK